MIGARVQQAQADVAAATAALESRLKRARQTGTLDVTGVDFGPQVPEAVWDVENGSQEGEKWWEAAPLVALKLGRNSITGVLDKRVGSFPALRLLDVSRNQLTGLPASLAACPELKVLNAEHNHLTDLPDELFTLPILAALNVSHNHLLALPVAAARLCPALSELDISANSLGLLPPPSAWPNLTVLNIEENKLTELPGDWSGCAVLRELRLGHNAVSDLPESLCKLPKLALIDARNNNLRSIRAGFLYLAPALLELLLDNNQLESLPDAPGSTSQPVLKVLQVSGNPIRELPAGLGEIRSLVTLNLANCQLSGLPPALGMLSGSLNHLVLDGNPLRSIRRGVIEQGCKAVLKLLATRMATDDAADAPGGAGAGDAGAGVAGDQAVLNALEAGTLQLSGQALSSVPAAVFSLPPLAVCRLHLSRNNLTYLPTDWSPLAASLTELYLARNKLAAVPDTLACLEQLQTLDLAYNMLRSLPATLAKLPALAHLDVSGNHGIVLGHEWAGAKALATLCIAQTGTPQLPPWLGSLAVLQTLNASNNQIVDLPADQLVALSSLRDLDVSNNNVSQIDPHVGLMTQLQSLSLAGNPLRSIRPAVLAKGTPAVLQTLRNRIPE